MKLFVGLSSSNPQTLTEILAFHSPNPGHLTSLSFDRPGHHNDNIVPIATMERQLDTIAVSESKTYRDRDFNVVKYTRTT